VIAGSQLPSAITAAFAEALQTMSPTVPEGVL
jgi:hypothetical protein